mmetsp:Transcript_95941/g.185042  ORF Transcript_95941/g.185042 Transcript_95941/m.185042 type:complete len:101 (+) Transcript_95941:263-565(+)
MVSTRSSKKWLMSPRLMWSRHSPTQAKAQAMVEAMAMDMAFVTAMLPRRGRSAVQRAAMMAAMLQKGMGLPLAMVGQKAVTAVLDIEAHATKGASQDLQV